MCGDDAVGGAGCRFLFSAIYMLLPGGSSRGYQNITRRSICCFCDLWILQRRRAKNMLLKGQFEKEGQKYTLSQAAIKMSQWIGNGWKAWWLDIVRGHVYIGRCYSNRQQKQQKGRNLGCLIQTPGNQQETTANFGYTCPIRMVFGIGQSQVVSARRWNLTVICAVVQNSL